MADIVKSKVIPVLKIERWYQKHIFFHRVVADFSPLNNCIIHTESVSQRISKIGQHLAKLQTKVQWHVFFDSQCRYRRCDGIC